MLTDRICRKMALLSSRGESHHVWEANKCISQEAYSDGSDEEQAANNVASTQ